MVLLVLQAAMAVAVAVAVLPPSSSSSLDGGGGRCRWWPPCRCSSLVLQCVGRNLSFAVVPREAARGVRRLTLRGCVSACAPLPDAVDAWHLDVSGNALRQLSLSALARAPQLREVRAERCSLTRLAAPPVGVNGTVLRHLSALYLAGNQLANLSALALARLPALRLLDLRGNPLLVPADSALLAGVRMPALEVLLLEGAQGPAMLGAQTVCHLQELRVLQVDASGVRRLGNVRCLRRLRRLSLRGNALRQLLLDHESVRRDKAAAVEGGLFGELLLDDNPLLAMDVDALSAHFLWRRALRRRGGGGVRALEDKKKKVAVAVVAKGFRVEPSSWREQEAAAGVVDVSSTPLACDGPRPHPPRALRLWSRGRRLLLRASCPASGVGVGVGGVAQPLWSEPLQRGRGGPVPPLGERKKKAGAVETALVAALVVGAWMWLFVVARCLGFCDLPRKTLRGQPIHR